MFIKGHHIKDTEQELREPDLNVDPLACYMKMRFVSDHNPDGVWIKFPLSGMAAMDDPDTSGEVMVALKSLGIQSIEEARFKGCESCYPVLTKCMEYSEGDTLANVIFKAHNLWLA